MRSTPARSVQARAAATACVVLVLAFAAASAAQEWLGVSRWHAFTSALLFHFGATLALLLVRDAHPHPRFGPANVVTTTRAAVVALLAGLVFEPASLATAWAATMLAAVNTALDGVDGWLARRTGLSSVFGARFDMETDSVFVLVLSLLLWRHDRAGAWVLAGGLYRYAFVASGWVLPWMAGPLRPTKRARVTAACHMLGLTVALAPIVPGTVSRAGAAATLALLTWSFAVDVGRLWRGETT